MTSRDASASISAHRADKVKRISLSKRVNSSALTSHFTLSLKERDDTNPAKRNKVEMEIQLADVNFEFKLFSMNKRQAPSKAQE